MLKNYFTTAWRNLKKHRAFSFINILGLAIGMAAFWLISLYVTDELSYDRYNTKADRIYRVVQHGKWKGGQFDLALTAPPFADALKTDFANVEEAIRLDPEGGGKIVFGDKQVSEGSMLFSDAGFFRIFTHKFLYGDANTALNKPQSIVLTKTLAEAIFGNAASAVGQNVIIDGKPNAVTAVIADVPANSHFTFKALRSMPADFKGPWSNSYLYTYVLLKHAGDNKAIDASSDKFFNKYLKKDMGAMAYSMELQPVRSIHLHSNLGYELGVNGNITYIYVFGVTALLILVIAVINYVNLATARSSIRLKEIGVRRVIGSDRGQLMVMFFAESILLALIAMVIAAMLVQLALPYFNQLSGKTLVLLQFGTLPTVGLFLGFAFLVGLLSGIYPALFLSGFGTINAMKGQLGDQLSTILFRKSLVVFQFVITVVMLVGSCIIYQQLRYAMTRDLGFNKEQTLTFHISRSARGKIDALKHQLLLNRNIEAVGAAGNPLGNNNMGSRSLGTDASGDDTDEGMMIQVLQADEDLIPTLQVKMLQGRNFSKQIPSDVIDAVIVNQTLVNKLGWKDPVGRRISLGKNDDGTQTRCTIVGVVKDFNTYSLQHKIMPLLLRMPYDVNEKDNLYIRIGRNNVKESLAYISRTYAAFDIEDKPEFHFLDQNFAAQYQTEEKQGAILLVFTILAISIACLGLFGLVTFTAEQRVKEIGIRKVLGASVGSIVSLLSADLMKLVLIATVIATPIAWFAMNKWLQDFEYRINVSWWVFLMAGLAAGIIALGTISIQSVKAALANPAKSLKSE